MDAVLVPVTVVSMVAALVAGGVAWRLSRSERRRSEARVAALAAEIAALEHGEPHAPPAVPLPPRPPAPRAEVRSPSRPVVTKMEDESFDSPLPRPSEAATSHAELFGTTREAPRARGRLASVVGIGAMVVGLAIAGIYWINAPAAGVAEASRPSASDTDTPLELVSLKHARQAQDWTITGLVQNPAGGRPVERVAAVAFLFDSDGSFVGSGRTPLEVQMLLPGDESPFIIKIKAAGKVERYRISFRGEDGRIVRHLDRRVGAPAS